MKSLAGIIVGIEEGDTHSYLSIRSDDGTVHKINVRRPTREGINMSLFVSAPSRFTNERAEEGLKRDIEYNGGDVFSDPEQVREFLKAQGVPDGERDVFEITVRKV